MIPVWRIYEDGYHKPLLGHVRAHTKLEAMEYALRTFPNCRDTVDVVFAS